MANPERVLWERSNCKEVPQFLKSNRIKLSYGLTINKDQTFIRVAFFLLTSRNMSILFYFRALGDMNTFDPLGSAFEGHGSPPSVNRYVCIPSEGKNVCTDYFQKSMQIYPAQENYITDSNTTFRSRSRGSLIGSDSDSDSWLVATTPGDSGSDSGSESASLL